MKSTVLFWLIMVMILSIYPIKSPTPLPSHSDLLFHAMLYAITCLLFYTALRPKFPREALLLSVLLATGYGFIMEVAQQYTGYRTFSWLDVLANLTGAGMAGLYVMTSIRRKQANRSSK